MLFLGPLCLQHKSSYVSVVVRHRRVLPVLPSLADSEESKALVPARALTALEEAVAYLLKTRKTKNTRDAYTLDWKQWREFAAGAGLDLTSPTVMDALRYHEALKSKYGAATCARRLASLAFFYRALQAAALVRVNPFDSAWLPRDAVATGITRAADLNASDRLLQTVAKDLSLEGIRDMALLSLIASSGARRASVRGALREDVDLITNTLRVVLKGGKIDFLKFTKSCAEALRRWIKIAPASRFLFPSAVHGVDGALEGIALSTVNRILTARCIEAGVEHLHPHQFRSAFITDGYSAKVPERDLQVAAHHADAAMTRKYDRGVRGEHVADKIEAYRAKQREVHASAEKALKRKR